MPNTRAHARRDFACQYFRNTNLAITPASNDASFRSYWRVVDTSGTHIIMDAPPSKEDVRPWLEVGRRMHVTGLHTPEVLAEDLVQGFLLIEDLGSRMYLPELNAHTVNALYADALDALIHMQTKVDVSGLPAYDESRLVTEMELLPEWFLKHHLGFIPECDEWDIIENAFRCLVNSALSQPCAFVHRDYHSRNLLVTANNSPGIIDFQDAVVGPITYDLVSLLRDCYISWNPAQVDGWIESYRQRVCNTHFIDSKIGSAQFHRWFDLMGLQRHIKVLGIFCRLWYRDGKRHYLNDLPLVWHYVVVVAQRYPELADFIRLLERGIGGRDLTVPNKKPDYDVQRNDGNMP